MRAVHADAIVTGDADILRDGAIVLEASGEIVDVGAAVRRAATGSAGIAVERTSAASS